MLKAICKHCMETTNCMEEWGQSAQESDPVPWGSHDDERWTEGLVHCPDRGKACLLNDAIVNCLRHDSQRACCNGVVYTDHEEHI
jgi:hypothetical protein